MKVRKKMASILSVLTLTGFLAACGNGATEETGGTTSPEANGEKIELNFLVSIYWKNTRSKRRISRKVQRKPR